MKQQLERQMLNALELFHYANRFRGQLFVLHFLAEDDLAELLTDLKTLLTAKVRLLLLLPLATKLHLWEGFGLPFAELTQPDRAHLQEICDQGLIAYCICPDLNQGHAWARELGAKKIIYLRAQNPLADLSGAAITQADLAHLESSKGLPLFSGIDQAFVEVQSGNLFLEIFTHEAGTGTLVATTLEREIRPAGAHDMLDILLVLKPHIQTGAILPVTLSDLAKEVDQYFVAQINGELVATARLKPWGNFFELAKFCTLPRYRGKGIAQALCQRLIEEAELRGASGLFALSIESAMWRFFEGFGFEESPKTNLPQAWQEQYDQTRGSKAFLRALARSPG